MKKNTHYLILPFFISVLCFFLFSCSKEENQQSALHLQILKTETNMNHKGGYVLIQTNVEGAEVRVKDAWLTPEISGSQIRLTALANPGYESRTTLVFISKGDELQQLPVTQLGIISIVDVQSYEFPETGGNKAFLWNTDQEFQIEGLDNSWLTYETRGDSIYFTASELGLYDDTRQCSVNIRVGRYYQTEVVFKQTAPVLPYQLLLGEYTLEYTRWVGTDILSTDVSLIEKEYGKSFILKGLAFDITVLFDPSQARISIKSQPLQAVNDQEIWLAAWEGQGSGSLWPNKKFGVMSQWNGDKRNIELTMIPDGVTDEQWKDKSGNPIITRGFILWGKNEYTAGGPSRLINMKLIKKN